MIYGIDEVGRGCLAGPVCAACVGFSDNQLHRIKQRTDLTLGDSKALSPEARTVAARIIRTSFLWGIGWAYPHEIDALNIHHASLLAMQRAFENLQKKKHSHNANTRGHADNTLVLVDGIFTPQLPYPSEAKPKGDTYIAQIQAASIVAKVSRDSFMHLLHRDMPEYHFNSNKGYPTKAHKHAIYFCGIRNHVHRKSFSLPYPNP